MDTRWLAVLYTWALLAQFSRAFPEEELPDKLEIGEPKLEGKTDFFKLILEKTFSKTTELNEIKYNVETHVRPLVSYIRRAIRSNAMFL